MFFCEMTQCSIQIAGAAGQPTSDVRDRLNQQSKTRTASTRLLDAAKPSQMASWPRQASAGEPPKSERVVSRAFYLNFRITLGRDFFAQRQR